MSKKLKIQHLHTTGVTSPNDLLYGEIAISHGEYYSNKEKKNYGPRIYTRSDNVNEKNIEYIPSWEIERTVTGRYNEIASTSNFGFVNIFSGETENIINQLGGGSINSINEKTKIIIKPEYGIDKTCKLITNINIVDNKKNEELFKDLVISFSRNDFYGDAVSIVCERINNIYPIVIAEKKINEIIAKNGWSLKSEVFESDDEGKYPHKFTLKSGDTIYDELIIESFQSMSMNAGIYINLSNHCFVIPVDEYGCCLENFTAQTEITVYKFGQQVMEYKISFGQNDEFDPYTDVSGGTFTYKKVFKKGESITWVWSDIDVKIEVEGLLLNQKAVTSANHTHNKTYTKISTSELYTNKLDENVNQKFANFSEGADLYSWNLANIQSNLSNEVPIFINSLVNVLDKTGLTVDEVSKNILSIEDKIVGTGLTGYTELKVNHLREDNENFSFKINETDDYEFVNSFNNITRLPLTKGHILGNYFNILTSDISGITYRYEIDGEEYSILPDFIPYNQNVIIEIYANDNYKIKSASIEYDGFTNTRISEDFALFNIESLKGDAKIFVTATTTNELNETIEIVDNSLKNKNHKNYYYDKINYKYRKATEDRIGCVYIKNGNVSDKITNVNEKTCANNNHIHNDYFYINRNEDYSTGYTLSGIDFINCGTYD